MLNRRNFLKLGAASATAVFVGGTALQAANRLPIRGGKDFSPATGAERTAIPTACWQCVTRCPAMAYVENGRLVKVEGHPNSIRSEGVMCAKGQAGPNQLYDPDRILYPMKRVGARGEGKWKRISWDEALTEVASRMKKLRDEGAPEKVMFHYGRMKSSSSKLIGMFFANYGTGTIGDHTSICEGGKWTAQELTWGVSYDNWDFDKTRYILNFGSNVLEAHTNHIPEAHRLIGAMADRGVKMVTFDVRLSNTAAKSTEWLPVKPGTDLAVVLAMCNVIMSEDLHVGEGEDFLTFTRATPDMNATTEQKVAALKDHLAQYTPEWAEGISGVDANRIRTIAREFATTKPAVVISYRGAVAHHNGTDTERAIQMLASITGNIDNPGGRCKGVGASWKYPSGPKEVPEARKLSIIDGFKGSAAFPTHHQSHSVLKMIKDGSAGRPDMYVWYCYAPVYANGEVQENIDVLKDEALIPFTVCSNPFYDESAALADLLLPDATYLERWDTEDNVSPTQTAEYAIRQPVVTPLGEARDFGDVCIELADRMGFPLGLASKEDFVRQACEMTPGVRDVGGFDYMKAEGVWHDPQAEPRYYSYRKELKPEDYQREGVVLDPETGTYWDYKKAKADSPDKGYVHTKKSYTGYVGQRIGDKVYAGFKPDKVNKSGYMELYSSLLEEKGFPPLPTWTAVPEHQTMKPGELVLITYKVAMQIQSRSANCKWLTEIFHDNPGWINPETAASLGLVDGGTVKVASSIGEIETTVRITPAVVPGVIAIAHHCGHWEYGRYASGKRAPEGVDERDDGRIWWTSNGTHPNWIIPNTPDPISGQQRWMDTVVTVTPKAAA